MSTSEAGPLPFTSNHQKANRYSLALVDMQEALEYLDAYDELDTIDKTAGNSGWFVARKGLLSIAIVAYCRPFKSSQSKGFADGFLKTDELPRLRKHELLHDLVVTKRDKFVAHADWTYRSTRLLNAGDGFSSWRTPEPDVWEGLNLTEFREMIGEVMKDCFDIGHGLAVLAIQEGNPSV